MSGWYLGAGRGRGGGRVGQGGGRVGQGGAVWVPTRAGCSLEPASEGLQLARRGLHISGSREELGMKSSAEIQRIHIFGIKR